MGLPAHFLSLSCGSRFLGGPSFASVSAGFLELSIETYHPVLDRDGYMIRLGLSDTLWEPLILSRSDTRRSVWVSCLS